MQMCKPSAMGPRSTFTRPKTIGWEPVLCRLGERPGSPGKIVENNQIRENLRTWTELQLRREEYITVEHLEARRIVSTQTSHDQGSFQYADRIA